MVQHLVHPEENASKASISSVGDAAAPTAPGVAPVVGARHRWVPDVCKRWAIDKSNIVPAESVKRGRPRNVITA
jgi:hypothetical protein